MKFLFWFGVLFTLIAPLIIGLYFGDHSTSWLAALCGAFVSFLAKIGDLAELSLGPLKAKMREKMEEASATIAQLRQIATVTSEATLADLIAGYFLGGMSLKKRLYLHDNIVESLQCIGVSPEQIVYAEKGWKVGISIIYLNAIRHAIEGRDNPHKINPDATEDQKNAVENVSSLIDIDNWSYPSASQVRLIVAKYNIESEDVESWISDFEYFEKNNVIRNRSKFENH